MPVAKIDNSKPDNRFPSAFRPGGGVVEGIVEMDRANVRWRVLGYDLETGSLWCKRGENSGWIAPGTRLHG